MTKAEAARLIQDLKENSGSISVAHNSNEITGKLTKNGWCGIEWDEFKPGWYGESICSRHSDFIDESEVWKVAFNWRGLET